MKITLNEAKKMLLKLQSDKEFLLHRIDDLATYVAAVSENEEELRPEFSLEETVAEIEEIDKKIIKIHCARNRANNRMVLKPSGITIMEALIKLPILNMELKKWELLAMKQMKTRVKDSYGRNKDIEYVYANYPLEYAKKKYEQYRDEIAEIQAELDRVDITETFEVNV